ncbi:PRC-barrel domain-containing protein [Phormidesmis sp. 146-12]
MALMKFKEFYPDYRSTSTSDGFDIDDLKNFSVYADGNDKVGSVHDILVDAQDGRIRYFVVDTGFWVFGKKVLLPVGRANVDNSDNRIYVSGMTKEQVEELPNYDELDKIGYNYEEQVRNVYRLIGLTPGLAKDQSKQKTSKT